MRRPFIHITSQSIAINIDRIVAIKFDDDGGVSFVVEGLSHQVHAEPHEARDILNDRAFDIQHRSAGKGGAGD